MVVIVVIGVFFVFVPVFSCFEFIDCCHLSYTDKRDIQSEVGLKSPATPPPAAQIMQNAKDEYPRCHFEAHLIRIDLNEEKC